MAQLDRFPPYVGTGARDATDMHKNGARQSLYSFAATTRPASKL